MSSNRVSMRHGIADRIRIVFVIDGVSVEISLASFLL